VPTIFRDKVTSGSVTFNDVAARPLPGTIYFNIDVLDGWGGTPDLDAVFTPIGSIDGEIPADFFPAKGRGVSVGGYVEATTRAIAEQLWDILVRDAFPRNVELELTRYETIPKFLRFRRSGQMPDPAWVGPTAFRFGVPIRAADPFKYALTSQVESSGVAGLSTGGRSYPRTYPLVYTTIASGTANLVTINNVGTAPTPPEIVLNGPLSKGGWRLVNETLELADREGTLKFDVGLVAGDVLEINFRTETALLNGYLITASLFGDFWKVQPGVNVIKLYADFDPAAGFTVTARSAWE
jgi:hypothetical protein